MSAVAIEPSKTHKGENFPVASKLIAPQHRAAILAYYQFARGADDVVDNGLLSPQQKLDGLDAFEATLLGKSEAVAAAKPLRAILAAQKKLSPRHALALLRAFRMDAVKHRYANWDELMDYCAHSAAPVGRFVLDVHGESEATWPASDALCSALQVINHLQDCAADYRNLDRVYIPGDALAGTGACIGALAADKASPQLRASLDGLIAKTATLIETGAALPPQVRDLRLSLETAVIAKLAQRLNQILRERDPLRDEVHLGKAAALGWACVGVASSLPNILRRLARPAWKAAQ
ncbi:squalene synthase HpnC [Methylocella tundrae]|uniref:Hydroxysqualene synthase n=1 Tax=Methylocella tundrae TaxID=227605 RepID=A0A4U8Z146_METTU|nr:squalene synthase HpnC [Methylocella tundrae]WPP06310.1 squalene synthase HpnC [Methylocella tundrae]VFU09001.1 Hydroxysqualene synthase [Methylocella tundrae]